MRPLQDRNSAMVRSLQYAVVSTTDSHSIVRVNAVDKSRRVQVPTPAGAGEFRRVEVAPEPERDSLYQFFDEQYLSLVSRAMRWPRDRGVVELIPIVVGMGVVG